MSKVYDNWERLVGAVINREELRYLALCPSLNSSVSTNFSSRSFSFASAFEDVSADLILAKSIQLTDQVIKEVNDAARFKQACSDIKSMTQRLASLLRQARAATNIPFEHPTRRIIDDTEQVLQKALTLVLKCSGFGLVKGVFSIITITTFRKMSSKLENSIANVSWLLRFISSDGEHRAAKYLGLPPIATNEPILSFIWEHIVILHSGSLDDRSDAAASLLSMARDNDRYGRLIIEEGGVVALLKLITEGEIQGQENAARAIGLLGKYPENVEHMMIHTGVCSVFAKILEEGPMRVQAVVAWALSELASHYPKCQDLFAQHNIIPLLVSHLTFETVVQEHNEYAVVTRATSLHAATGNNSYGDRVVMTVNDMDDEASIIPPHPLWDCEMEDPETKAYMKAMTTRALWQLSKQNRFICRSITESGALSSFAVLLEEGSEEVRYSSAMALMEIAAAAAEDTELRRSAFDPNSPTCKAVINQLIRVIEKEDSELLIPCVKAIGNLATIFKAAEKRIIGPLVKLLEGDEREVEVSREACIALAKFACSYNYHHLDYSKAIIGAGGVNHLVQLVYFGEPSVQRCALILLCHIALHVPEREELAGSEVRLVLFWASKQPSLVQVEDDYELLTKAKEKMELYLSRG